MALRYAELMSTDHDWMISRNTDYDAWYTLEQGLLLALLESGTLSAMQYRLAEEALQEQRAERARRLIREGSK